MAFEHMLHSCLGVEGMNFVKVVTETDIERDRACVICGEPMAPTREVLAHIYNYLLEQSTHD